MIDKTILKIRLFKTYVVLFFLLAFKLAEATHVVGGEIYYDNLGNNNYKITMKVYRDCLTGVPPFDNPAFFTVFDGSGGVITTTQVPVTSSLTVPPTNNSPCAPAAAGNACVEEAIYTFTINLPPLVGGYYIAYQRCCRNGTILNLISPGNVGATYWEHIPGPEQVAVNSSPRFTYRPPIYICQDNPIAFNHVATDPDGDSLVYNLCTPFDGLDGGCPVIDPANTACGTANTPPPYVSVPFQPPYSSSYPMASNPAVNINQNTGFLDGEPTMQGQWVVGVCVSEYRHGQLIGIHYRDFQFNVIVCPFVVHADIVSQTTTNNGQGTGFCNGFTISYANASTGNLTSYHWDFGDTLTLADTSNVKNPTYTFTNQGTYTVSLIVNPGSPCADTTYEVFSVYPLLTSNYVVPVAQCFQGNSFNFSGTGSYTGVINANWDFGSGASPPAANTMTVNNVTYNAPGTYTVLFTISQNSCTATTTKTIEVYQSPQAAIGNFTTSGCAPLTVSFNNLSTAATSMAYTWNFSDGTTSTATNPVKTFTAAGIYTVSLTAITNQQCIDTSQVTAVNTITVVGIPTSSFNIASVSGLCFTNNLFNFANSSTTSGNASYTWNFDSHASVQTSTTTNQSNVNYNTPGAHTITLTVNEAGCINTSTQSIVLYNDPVASIGTFPKNGCTPFDVNFTNTSSGGSSMSYLWNFSDGTSSTSTNPVKTFNNEGVYSVTLTATSNTGCVSSSSISSVNSITVTQTPLAAFTSVSATGQCFDNNRFSFVNTSTISGNVTHAWSFGPEATPQSATSFNVPNVIYHAPGTYTVSLTESKNGCIDTQIQTVELYQNPVANMGIYPATGCDPLSVTFADQSTSASPLTYLWTFGDGTTSTIANPTHVFSPPGVHPVSLTVSTTAKCIGVSGASTVITVNPKPTAGFDIITDNESYVQCTNEASPDVTAWHYNFDDGKSSTDVNPIHYYSSVNVYYIVQTVTNSFGCIDTYTVPVTIIPEFAFWIPNAFTPNNKDGLNDVFKPKVLGVEDYTFSVFNRWGELIYQTHDIDAGWDGTYKGAYSPQDVYVWKCDFTNNVSKENEYHVGHVTLVR